MDSHGKSYHVPEPAVCPLCDGSARTRVVNDTFTWGRGKNAVELHVTMPVHRCAPCDIEFFGPDGEMLRHEAVCRHLGVLTPREVRTVRERVSRSRKAFARLTGIGEATLHRWETGIGIQNPGYDRLLRLLYSLPDAAGSLRNLGNGDLRENTTGQEFGHIDVPHLPSVADGTILKFRHVGRGKPPANIPAAKGFLRKVEAIA